MNEEVKNTQTEESTISNQDTKPNTEPVKKYTDEEVDEILNKKYARWQKKVDEQLEEERQKASMNAKELAQYEAQKKDKELEDAKNELNKYKMTSVANSKLSEKGLLSNEEILSFVVKEDELSTVKAVETFSQLVEKTVNEQLKERAKQSTPATSQTNVNTNDVSIRDFAQQNRLIK